MESSQRMRRDRSEVGLSKMAGRALEEVVAKANTGEEGLRWTNSEAGVRGSRWGSGGRHSQMQKVNVKSEQLLLRSEFSFGVGSLA
jgi:hypothetical protein